MYLTGIIQDTEGLFRSTDAGQTWLRIDDPAHQFGSKESITGDPRIFGRVYFGTGGRGILYGDPAPAR
jgi:xyloglucan-specific exo-beta-1,4-glucanase